MVTKTKKKATKTVVRKKTFKQMAPWEQRIAIARDVIAQINAKKFIATNSVYAKIASKTCSIDSQINKSLKEGKLTCQVCALGSLMMSHVNKTNHLTLRQLRDTEDEYELSKDRLKGIFSVDQLNLIELAFEGWIVNNENQKLRTDWGYTALGRIGEEFFDKYERSDERLIAICRNIIRFRGRFSPDKEK